jgi:BetI-type transcriptional repressor, C-terminal
MTASWLQQDPENWATSDPSRNPVRRRFVHASAGALIAQGLDVIARGIDIDRQVVPRSGRSRRTFYEAFKDGTAAETERSRLVAELVRETLDPERSMATRELAEQMVGLVGPDDELLSVDDQVRRYATDQYVEVLRDDLSRVQAVLWGLGHDDPVVRERFCAMYADWTSRIAFAIQAVVMSIGRELVEPYTPQSVAVVLTGLIEGLAVRARVDPDAVPRELFGEVAVTLMYGVTRPVGDQAAAV